MSRARIGRDQMSPQSFVPYTKNSADVLSAFFISISYCCKQRPIDEIHHFIFGHGSHIPPYTNYVLLYFQLSKVPGSASMSIRHAVRDDLERGRFSWQFFHFHVFRVRYITLVEEPTCTCAWFLRYTSLRSWDRLSFFWGHFQLHHLLFSPLQWSNLFVLPYD